MNTDAIFEQLHLDNAVAKVKQRGAIAADKLYDVTAMGSNLIYTAGENAGVMSISAGQTAQTTWQTAIHTALALADETRKTMKVGAQTAVFGTQELVLESTHVARDIAGEAIEELKTK